MSDMLNVTGHAQGHDALDRHGIPRHANQLEYTIAERIDLLAGAVEALAMADLLADAAFDDVPGDLMRKMAAAYRNSRLVIAARGQ